MTKTTAVFLSVLLVLTSMLVICCQQSQQEQTRASRAAQDSPVLARIGDLTITEADISAKQELFRFGDKEREKVIEDMIRSKLIYLAALEEKLDQDPKVQSRIQEQTEKIIGQIFLNDKISSLDFSEDELRKYYSSHKDVFKIPRKASIAHILFSSRDVAQQVLSDIKAGKITFEKAVAKHTVDKLSARNRGKLGMVMDNSFIPSIGPNPEINEQIFQAGANDIIGPFETNKGFHLIRVETLIPEAYEDFERAKRKIIDIMAVSDSEIEEYYNKIKDDRFKKKAFIKVKHIQTKSRKDAEKVLARIKKGEKFGDLVKTASLDKESISNGGDLGMIYREGYVPRIGKDINFINAVFQLEKGDISPVIKSAKGFHVVYAYDKAQESHHALEDVRSSIINILAGQKRVELRTKLMSDLEEKYPIERTYKK